MLIRQFRGESPDVPSGALPPGPAGRGGGVLLAGGELRGRMEEETPGRRGGRPEGRRVTGPGGEFPPVEILREPHADVAGGVWVRDQPAPDGVRPDPARIV